MKRNDLWFFLPTLAGALLLVLGLLSWTAQPAQAQCGSQASSCKSCHETQGQMPVNSNGQWHTVHAFGDFCEFCHAGNVQAKTKDDAHVGLVAPLDDVKAGCQSCHPTDYMDKAQIFASTLGVEVGTGSGGSDTGGGGSATGSTGVGAPLGGEEIDFNLLYAEATAQPLVSNWGNVILVLMILSTGGAFFVTAWSWEGWGPKVARWIDATVAPIPQAVATVNARGNSSAVLSKALISDNTSEVQGLLAQKPELLELLPKLMDCQPETLAALDRLLENPERGSEILAAISKVDTEVVTALRKIGTRDRNLLLALLKEI